jgi:putative ABC transport system permease protein
MLKNYLKIALRNLWRNKIYSIINLFGLALGITCALVIFIFLKYELSFDTFHTHSQQVYRIVQHNKTAEGMQFWNTTAYPLAEALSRDFPDIVTTQVAGPFNRIISSEDAKGKIRKFEEKKLLFVAPNYLDLFDFKGVYQNLWLEGNPKTAFSAPNAVVLSQKLAYKYFPEAIQKQESILGKVLKLNNKDVLIVSGLIKDLPTNTNLSCELLVSYAFFKKNNPFPANNWSGNYQGTTYLKLPKTANLKEWETKIANFKKKYLKGEENARIIYKLQPLSQIHTEALYGNSPGSYTISTQILGGLAVLGLFLIVIAGFNFVNLSTAIALKRSKEVGIRKVLGGTQRQLFRQFMGEVLLITALAFLVSLSVIELLLSYLNQYLQIINLNLNLDWLTFIFGLALVLIISLLAGFYPALVLANYSPINALKNSSSKSPKSWLSIRKSLIILQFGISYSLIFATIVISYQMYFFQTRDLGYNKEAIIKINIPNQEKNKLERFRQNLLKNPNIKNLSYASGTPTTWEISLGTTFRLNEESLNMRRETEMKVVDLNYFDLYNLKILAGNKLNKSNEIAEGFNGFVVNEALIKMLNLKPEEAIGKKISINEGDSPIIGVVKDFHNQSLQNKISPCVMFYWGAGFFWEANIQLQKGAINQATIASIEQEWKAIFPEWIPQLELLDEFLVKNYLVETLVFDAFKVFAGIAILISCLGLFGLSAFTSAQRSKEIGIRKVLGASVPNILKLLSQEFLLMVLFAGLLAFPVVFYLMNMWLQNFAYRIEISWWMFALAILLEVLVAMFTVISQSYKTAHLNPVEVLKNE